jgi:hypothetical protein
MTVTMTEARPIEGPAYDKSKPETRQPWLDFRRPGLTATMIRDWGTTSKRREILEEKATGEFKDLSDLPYVAHGNVREPVIAEWVRNRFGIEPCESVYAHPENSRHLASPDGVTLDPFSRELVVGTQDAVLAEIKTSKHDLTPGPLDADGVLIEIAQGSQFERSNYYTQMQWQMYVMNAGMTLFVWEQHDDKIDPETNTFTPIGPPRWAWVPRNDALIKVLVEKVAPKALAEIDTALAIRSNELPPASEFPAEDAILVQDVLKARDAAALAEASRTAAWSALEAKYVGEDKPDRKEDLGFAWLTVSTSDPQPTVKTEDVTDWDKVNATVIAQKYHALVARNTKPVTREIPAGKPVQKMTITAKKVKP